MNYNDIENYIKSGIQENEQLDYIQANHKFNDTDKQENVAKIVCAMANSGGGKIIYGVETDKGTPEKPVRITGIDASNPGIIESVIKDMIKPSIPNCTPGELIKDSSDKLSVYVITVPDSDFIPHQSVYNKVFYGRIGSASQPLDYIAVERLFNRQNRKLENIPIVILDQGDKQGCFLIRNMGNSPAINVEIKLNNNLIINHQCLGIGTNSFFDREVNIQPYLNVQMSNEFLITYQDILKASYEVIIRGNRDGIPKGEISRLARNGKILIGT